VINFFGKTSPRRTHPASRIEFCTIANRKLIPPATSPSSEPTSANTPVEVSRQANLFLILEVFLHPTFVGVVVKTLLGKKDWHVRRARLSKKEIPVVVAAREAVQALIVRFKCYIGWISPGTHRAGTFLSTTF